MKSIQIATALGVAAAALGIVPLMSGCGNDDGVNSNGTQGQLILMIHDAPGDAFKEVWLTVESVRMIGSDNDSIGPGEVILSQSVRMDFLELDSTARILAAAGVKAGSYSKIRLAVSDPELIRDDDSVFVGDDVQLVANGHVDINTQGDMLIVGNEVTVVSLDLDVANSIQINQTGNGRYIVRPQIFVDNTLDDEVGIIIAGAVITAVDLTSQVITVKTSGAESDATLTITTDVQTDILGIGGLPVALSTLPVGSRINVVGTIDVASGVVTATGIQVVP